MDGMGWDGMRCDWTVTDGTGRDATCAPGSNATPGKGKPRLDSYVGRPWKAAAPCHIRQDLPQSSTRLHTVAETPGCAASVGHSTTVCTVSTCEHITALKCFHTGNRKRTRLHRASRLGASTQAPWCEPPRDPIHVQIKIRWCSPHRELW